jgi:lipoprotein-anchoring transpeptidase ErfK/SrfK
MFACVVVIGGAHGAIAGPPTGVELTVADLGWPATTAAATFRHRGRVLDDATTGKRIAIVDSGTRVTWRRIVATHDGCRGWLELEPRGWACAAELAPTDKPAIQPTPAADERYADVRAEGADAYDDAAAIRAGTPARHVPDKTYVAQRATSRPINIEGVRYFRTDQGWIAGSDLAWYSPSDFSGLELGDASSATPAAALPTMGWAVAKKPGAKIAVRNAPADNAAKIRELAPRDRVAIAETRGDFARIGTDDWVDLHELRVATLAARPDGVGADEHWLDVDLDQQLLVAYIGDAPVFVTLVSTGRVLWQTPTGTYRITGKEARTRMQDPGGMADEWNVADVPWTMHFRRNFALHGTYWHDGFGRARSHGCVNLSTHDAKRVYDFVSPTAPDGWSAVEDHAGAGTVVRIHDAHDPNPIWRDYEGKPVKGAGASH